jgi:hypothetical protein
MVRVIQSCLSLRRDTLFARLSLGGLVVAQLRSQRFHVFSHEMLLRRLSSPPLIILPRRIGSFVLRSVRIRLRHASLRPASFRYIGLFPHRCAILLQSFCTTELRLQLVEEVLSKSRSVGAINARAALLFSWEAVAHTVHGFGDLLDAAVEAWSAQELLDGPAFEEM